MCGAWYNGTNVRCMCYCVLVVVVFFFFFFFSFFFFNDTATTEIYTLSLHDALPILPIVNPPAGAVYRHTGAKQFVRKYNSELTQIMYSTNIGSVNAVRPNLSPTAMLVDRKSTRLNSSHVRTSRMPSSA